MSDFEIEKIHQTVWVFKNALKESQEVVDYLVKNKEWTDWYTFGTMAEAVSFEFKFDNFPTQNEWDNKKDNSNYNDINLNNYVENKINDLFYQTTKLYLEENNVDFNKWIYKGWNVAKYTEHPNDSYAMMHHTDFQRDIAYSEGEKFGITAVFYLNDNYDGGEVEFRFLDDEKISVIKEDYSYKPGAGDIVVFMSGHPHYHGVKAVTKGEKYIIRTYWKYYYEGHPLWNKLKEKYGEEVWAQMEDERMKFNRKSENMTIINNIPFWLPFENYYKNEILDLDL